MVIDTSALLAVFLNEKHAPWVQDRLDEFSGSLLMSTVNLAETLILLKDLQPRSYEELENELLESSIQFVAPDIQQVKLVAAARMKYPLNLGDCFAYALAKATHSPILTLDRDFRKVDADVMTPY